MSAGDLVVRGGTLVTPTGLEPSVTIVAERGRIVRVTTETVAADGKAEFDATGKLLFPGLTDPQVHFREPGLTHKEDLQSGALAAIAGGVTAFCEMPNTKPNTDSPERLAEKFELAEGRAAADYAFFLGGTRENAEALGEWESLPGCAGIKVFMGSSTGSLLVPDDPTLEKILRSGSRRVTFHAEDDDLLKAQYAALPAGSHVREHPHVRSVECAVRATTRLLDLAEKTGRPIHILHISTADEIHLVRERDLGDLVTLELTPNHLFLEAPECYERAGTWAQMNPPVRDRAHQEVLREAAVDGTAACIGSDHAPHTAEDKGKPFPRSASGIAGVQTTLPLLLTAVRDGWLRSEDVLRLCVQGPARVYGIQDRGPIVDPGGRPGVFANLAVVDPDVRGPLGEQPFHSRAGVTPFANVELAGWPVATILRGRVAYAEGALAAPPGGERIDFDQPA